GHAPVPRRDRRGDRRAPAGLGSCVAAAGDGGHRARAGRQAAEVTRAIPGPVAAVVTDDLEAVRAVRHAVRLARDWDRPLLLLVPLPGTGLSLDPALHEVARRRRERDAAAVLGRITPALGGRPAPAHVVTYRPVRARTPALTAALRAARRAGAEVVVCGPRAAGRTGTRGLVLLDPVTGLAASGQPAPSPSEGVGEHVPR
ncbi:hypothetical protein E9529_12215, partial [Blastococcus sp. KM273128]|nr:hypothetical protein [Blastococcus sp. KM273128]